MKKKYILGSVIVALLMLVSTQVVFLNIVKSDPDCHVGDANAGSLWISELDVSSIMSTFDDIGVAHANATDDWVCWEQGQGSIDVSWEVDIDSTDHPEYWIIFSLSVFNLDSPGFGAASSGIVPMANDIIQMTCDADTTYDTSGTLSADITFSQAEMQQGEATLVCNIGAFIKLNGTIEAKNFSIWSEDRSIIGVDFIWPREEPFSDFIDESNEKFSSMWSYLPEWDESMRFSDEDDMLNNQTLVLAGYQFEQPDQNQDWDIGNLTLDILYNNFTMYGPNTEFELGDEIITWHTDSNGDIHGKSFIDWEVQPKDDYNFPILMNYYLYSVYPDEEKDIARNGISVWTNLNKILNQNIGRMKSNVQVDDAQGTDINNDDNISVNGWAYSWNIVSYVHWTLSGAGGDYNIWFIDDGSGSGTSGNEPYDWYGSLAYSEGSIDIGLSGSGQISVDITEGLIYDNEFIYVFAGDVGDTTVELTC